MSPRQRVLPTQTDDSASSSPSSTPRRERERELDPTPIVMSSSKPNDSTATAPLLTSASTGSLSPPSQPKQQAKQQSWLASIPQKRQTYQPGDVDIEERDRHDVFNLIALLVFLGAVWINWDLTVFFTTWNLHDSWHGHYSSWLVVVINLYFVIDLLWVSIIPMCVKSPGLIVKHHIIAIIYNLAPVYYPEYRIYMGPVLSVELNTWFLILRRFLYKRKQDANNNNNNANSADNTNIGWNVPNALLDLVDYAFYSSWIIIRVFGYHAILYCFFVEYAILVEQHQLYLQIPILFVVTQSILCALNLKWTYDLFAPIVQKHVKNYGLSSSSSSSAAAALNGTTNNNNPQREESKEHSL